jgi:hypothetical protein
MCIYFDSESADRNTSIDRKAKQNAGKVNDRVTSTQILPNQMRQIISGKITGSGCGTHKHETAKGHNPCTYVALPPPLTRVADQED